MAAAMPFSLQFKTLKGQIYPVQLPSDQATITEVKAAVEAALPAGQFPVAHLRLIHQGKELADNAQTLAGYQVSNNDTVVVMASKPKPSATTPAPPPPSSTPAPPPPAPPTTTTTATTTTAAPAPAPAPAAAPAAPPQPNAKVEQLKEMGFAESQVVAALAAADNDTNVAIEFLFSGNIPAAPATGAEGGLLAAGVGGMGDLMPGGGGAGGGGADAAAVAQLATHPEMENLRRLVRENPSSMEAAIATLASTHPDLVRLINEDPESFWAALEGGDLLEEDDDEEEDGDEEGSMVVGAVDLTDADEAAISRLMEMGFGRDQVVEAYLLSGKDENQAVNLLLGG